VAAHFTGFEDSNYSANVSIDSNATGQGMILSNISENLALLNNGSNGHSVSATVPTSAPLTIHR
jgi:type 1 fimbria pilin